MRPDLRFCNTALLLLACCASVPAVAADLPHAPAPAPVQQPDGFPVLPPAPRFEVRLGVFVHDPWSPEKYGGADGNGEFLTPRLFATDNLTWAFLVPRAHVGATVNFNGATSTAYAGLSWTLDLSARFFVEASLGGAVHNGKTGTIAVPDHNALGCSPLFRESASIGYRITDAWSVMATVEHLSNGGLCSNNRGLTNAGVRLGYTF